MDICDNSSSTRVMHVDVRRREQFVRTFKNVNKTVFSGVKFVKIWLFAEAFGRKLINHRSKFIILYYLTWVYLNYFQ